MESVTRFLEQTRLFVAWVRGSEHKPKDALRTVVALYASALELPSPSDVGVDIDSKMDQEEWQIIYRRLENIPPGQYSEIFDPLKIPPEEPVLSDLADDLADIYRDVKEGLQLWDQGYKKEAHWSWHFGFHAHWGEHATGAIRALHAFIESTNFQQKGKE